MIITVKYATYVAEKSKPENFRLAGIRTLPYLCDMGDISSSRISNICNSYIGRFYTDDTLSVWTNLIKHFVVRLVMRLKYEDGKRRIMRTN